MPGESIFSTESPQIRRRQALSLLNDYSHPWDVLAEALQNAVDAINRRFREQVADKLEIELDVFEKAIEEAADLVVNSDYQLYNTNYNEWASPNYYGGQKGRWFDAVATKLTFSLDKVKAAYESVEGAYIGKISILRNDTTRKLIVRDNGIGMSFDEMKDAVKKGRTIKKGFDDIGELGNGLTYLVSACDSFELETSDGHEHSKLKIDNMHSWITNPTPGLLEPLSNPEKINDEAESFTQVTMEQLRNIDSDFPDIFGNVMPTERLINLIRTKTAIGFLYSLLRFPVYNTLREESLEIELSDTFQGATRNTHIPLSYRSPSQVVRENWRGATPPIITLDNARASVRAGINIGGHSIESIGIYVSEGGRPLYYCSFVANRDWFKEASKISKACDNPNAPDLSQIGTYDIAPHIELGVKGMPTGINVDPPVTGFQGYWGNFHIIIMDNKLKFDEGRKTPVGRRVNLYRQCAEKVLFDRTKPAIISAAIKDAVIPLSLPQMAEDARAFVARRLANRLLLGYPSVKILNKPKFEQDVIILFHEMVGAEILPYYNCLDASSNSTYDGIYQYKVEKNMLGAIVQQLYGTEGFLEEQLIVEFKHTAASVIEDIAEDVKFYYMIDLLVCWELGVEQCNRLGATFVQKPMDRVKYWGTTHELQLTAVHFMNTGNGRSIEVICLKELIEKLISRTYHVP